MSQRFNKRVFENVSATKLVHSRTGCANLNVAHIQNYKKEGKNGIVQPIQYNILPTPYIYKCTSTRVYSFGCTRSLLRLTVANVDNGRRDFSTIYNIILLYYVGIIYARTCIRRIIVPEESEATTMEIHV